MAAKQMEYYADGQPTPMSAEAQQQYEFLMQDWQKNYGAAQPTRKAAEKKSAKKPKAKASETTTADVKGKAPRASKAAWQSGSEATENAKEELVDSGTVAAGLQVVASLRAPMERVGYKLSKVTLGAGLPPTARMHLLCCVGDLTVDELLDSDEGARLTTRHRAILRCLRSVDSYRPGAEATGFFIDSCDVHLGHTPSVDVHFAVKNDNDLALTSSRTMSPAQFLFDSSSPVPTASARTRLSSRKSATAKE